MGNHWTQRSCLCSVVASDNFIPRREWDIPQGFTDPEIVQRNLALADARAAARTHNRAQVQKRDKNPASWDRRWLIVLASPHAQRGRRRPVTKEGSSNG